MFHERASMRCIALRCVVCAQVSFMYTVDVTIRRETIASEPWDCFRNKRHFALRFAYRYLLLQLMLETQFLLSSIFEEEYNKKGIKGKN